MTVWMALTCTTVLCTAFPSTHDSPGPLSQLFQPSVNATQVIKVAELGNAGNITTFASESQSLTAWLNTGSDTWRLSGLRSVKVSPLTTAMT